MKIILLQQKYMIDFIIPAFVLQNNSRKGKQILNHLSHPFSSSSNNVLCCLDNDLFRTDRELINPVNTSKADYKSIAVPSKKDYKSTTVPSKKDCKSTTVPSKKFGV